MAVVIGEIEVSALPAPPPPPSGGGKEQGGDQKPGDTAKEIDKILHKHAQRSRRLWAY